MTINFVSAGLWVLRLIAALVMLQTLFFKFTGAEESVYIFSQLGIEPWGRIGTGVVELVASILILYPRTSFLGAGIGAGLMAGAIFFHLTKLGIAVKGDSGQLFIYAILTFISCIILLAYYRQEVINLFKGVFFKTSTT